MPVAPQIDSESWVQTDEWSETVFENGLVTVTASTRVYERPELRAETESLVSDQTNYSPHGLFTTGLAFSPPPPVTIPTGRLFRIAGNFASSEFESSLTDDGLVGVEQTGSRDLRLGRSTTAKAYQYDGSYPVTGPASDSEHLLSVRVWMALWPTAESFAMAGGVYPVESLPAPLESGDCNLSVQPAEDRRELFDQIRNAAQ